MEVSEKELREPDNSSLPEKQYQVHGYASFLLSRAILELSVS